MPLDNLTQQDKINRIAELSEAILEDPNSAFVSDSASSSVTGNKEDVLPSKFQRLLELAQKKPRDLDSTLSLINIGRGQPIERAIARW